MNDKYIFVVGFGVFCLMLGYIYIFLSAIRTMVDRDEMTVAKQIENEPDK